MATTDKNTNNNEQLKKLIFTMRDKYKELDAKYKTTLSELAQLKNSNNVNEKDMTLQDELNNRIVILTNDNKTLTNNIKELNNQLDDQKNTVITLTKEKNRLSEMVDQLTNKMKESNEKNSNTDLEEKYNKCLEEKRVIENTYINDQTEAHITINTYKKNLDEMTLENNNLMQNNMKITSALRQIEQILINLQ